MTLEEFKELKPGDKVKIIDRPIWRMKNGAPEMDEWRGQIMTVSSMRTSKIFGPYALMKDGITKEGFINYYCWYPWMIEKKVSGTITMEIPESGGKILTETEVKIMLLEREFAEFREQIKDELTRLKARLFDYMDKK